MVKRVRKFEQVADNLVDKICKEYTYKLSEFMGNRIKPHEVLVGIKYDFGEEKDLYYDMIEHSYLFRNSIPNKGESKKEVVCFIVDAQADRVRLGTIFDTTGEVIRVYKPCIHLSEDKKKKVIDFAKGYIETLNKTMKEIEKITKVG